MLSHTNCALKSSVAALSPVQSADLKTAFRRIWYNIYCMSFVQGDEENREPRVRLESPPAYSRDWDALLNVYNVRELPVLPADGDPGSESLPLGLKVLREFCLEAALGHALEVWFDFAPRSDPGVVDACWSSSEKGTTVVRLPGYLLMDGDDDLGIFGYLLRNLTDDGMFAIHVTEFRDAPGAFTGRPRSPSPQDAGPTEKPRFPGLLETATIRAFRVVLKGRIIPNDIVIQISPRFWHMPTGFEVG